MRILDRDNFGCTTAQMERQTTVFQLGLMAFDAANYLMTTTTTVMMMMIVVVVMMMMITRKQHSIQEIQTNKRKKKPLGGWPLTNSLEKTTPQFKE